MSVGQRIRRAGCLLLAHALHALVLLAPTLVFAGLGAMRWATLCFASSIVVAGVLESLCVSQPTQIQSATIQDKLAMRVAGLVGIGMLALFWIAQIEVLACGTDWFALQLAGGLLVVAGIGLRVAAIRTLGPQFVSDICAGSRVVRDGVYAHLRHPSEVGLLLIAIGGPLLLGAPLTALVAVGVLLPVSLWRMRREDVALGYSWK